MDNKIYENILARRSIRKFKDKEVETSKIETMLKAAMAAPSACNLQPWSFIVVNDKSTLKDVKKVTQQGDYNAPLIIVICGEYKHIPWTGDGWMIDCGAAMENMMLEAVELELSSVCVGGFDSDSLRDILSIPTEVEPICIIEIGYPYYQREPHTWYTDEAVYWNKYDVKRKRTRRTLQMLSDDIKSKLI